MAPEHLCLLVAEPDALVSRLHSYGTLFLGARATVAFSDKAIGTNHTLPTRRAARFTGGLSVASFLKTVTTVRCTDEGARLISGPAAVIADAEGMAGHAISSRLRLDPEYFKVK
jgi:sulfopropanediol 3-dehydrogenase